MNIPEENPFPAPNLHPLCRYRQVVPARPSALKIETCETVLFLALQIVNVSRRALDIDAVHVDAAVPLRLALVPPPKFLRLTRFPLRLARGRSFSLLLQPFLPSPVLSRLGYSRLPEKIIVTTGEGLLIFAAAN